MKIIVALMLSLSLAAFLGCNKKESQQSQQTSVQPGKVVTTAAYEKYFGGPPFVDKGTAYAFVIYFPSARSPGKVVPFPFFTFEEGSLKKVAVERLLSGMETGSYHDEFLPVPNGTRLLAITDGGNTITANFSKELAAASDPSILQAITSTLGQFKGVTDLRIQIEGKEYALTAKANAANDSVVQQPSAPRLLSLTAMRDKGATNIEDVNAFFDRPVEVKELKLLSKDEQQFAGELYHSVFDMAAVLKPKDTSQFKERMPIKVRWKVVDKLGRPAEGENVWFLEVKEH